MKKTFRPMVHVADILADARIAPRMLRVLLAFYMFADADGKCHPRRAQLAELTGYDEGSIRKAAAALQEIGWLERDGKGGRGNPASYRITPQRGEESSPLSDAQRGAESTPVSTQKRGAESTPQRGAESSPLSAPPIVKVHTNNIPVHSPDKLVSDTPAPAQEPEAFALSATPAKRTRSTPAERPHDVTEGTWEDWCAHRRRKKATITAGIIETARELAEEWGWSLEKYLKAWVLHGTQGFHPSWVERKQNGAQNGGTRYETAMERNAREAQKWLNPKPAAQPSGAIIDVEPANRGIFQLLEKTQ